MISTLILVVVVLLFLAFGCYILRLLLPQVGIPEPFVTVVLLLIGLLTLVWLLGRLNLLPAGA